MGERVRRLSAAAIIVLIVALTTPVNVQMVAAEPSLDLNPWRGSCKTVVTALGSGFLPDQALTFTAQLEGSSDDLAVVFAQSKVAADGTVTVNANIATIVPGCTNPEAVAGQQYRLSARDSATNSLLAYAIFAITAPEATPTIALEPADGPCATQNPIVIVRGGGFPPNSNVTIGIRSAATEASLFPGTIVGPDGSFAAPIRLIGCGPDTPSNSQFFIFAYSGNPANGDPLNQLAAAIYNTGINTAGQRCFTETGFCIAGEFRARWEATGGLAINGYPLSKEFKQRLEDGKEYTVQYFERVRLEYHPENQPPQNIQLGQFGRQILSGVKGAPTEPVSPHDGSVFFSETGHTVANDFFAYWQTNGGLNQFGYPLTEEFTQQLADGKTYTVQYFERARFERHPENQAPYTILLGQFGRQILQTANPPR